MAIFNKKEEQALPNLQDINLSFEEEMGQKQLDAQEEMVKTLGSEAVASDITLKAHTPLLEDIKRGLDASALTMKEKFGRFVSNLGGLMPKRADIKSRHAAEKAEIKAIGITEDMLGIAKLQYKTNLQIKEALVGNRLSEIETGRETQAFNEKLLASIQGLRGEEKDEEPSFIKKIFKGLFLLGIAIAGFLVGFKQALMAQLVIVKNFFKTLKIMDKLRAIGTAIKTAFKESKIGKAIMKAFEPIRKVFSKEGAIGKAITFIKTQFSKVGKFFTKIKNFFSSFINLTGKSSTVGKVFGWAKNLGKIVGKFFLPLTILMGAWEMIQGFIKGFKKDGIIGGIIGALDGLIEFLVDAPLNMIKDLVSWLLKKLGFDDASASLDAFEFDFSGMISDAFYGIVNWVRGLFGMSPLGGSNELPLDGVGGEEEWSFMGMLGDMWNGVTEWFSDIFSWENIKEGLLFLAEWSLPGMLIKVLTKIIDWFSETFSWENLKSMLPSFSDFTSGVGDFFSGSDDSEPAGEGSEKGTKEQLKKEKHDHPEKPERKKSLTEKKVLRALKQESDFLKEKKLDLIEKQQKQAEFIKRLQAENNDLKDKNAGGSPVAINNAPVNAPTVNNSSENFTLPTSVSNTDGTLQNALKVDYTALGF